MFEPPGDFGGDAKAGSGVVSAVLGRTRKLNRQGII